MNILLGITGSIAAYKALELIRLLRKQDSDVRVILTQSGLNFVTPLSCQTLSGNEVYLDQFVLTKGIKHLTLGEWSDILVVAPATANTIGKAASGIGDDLLSTTLISYQKPVLMVPAMDQGMWDNRIVQRNVRMLSENGVYFLQPSIGMLASGRIGRGRFPSVSMIAKKIKTIIEKQTGLHGMKFLVTGGRTEEDLDPVRVLTNRSTGLMGRELLQAIYCRGGEARGIFGEVALPLPEEVDITRVRTSHEMLSALKDNFSWCDCLIMAAAVGDYRPKRRNTQKAHSAEHRAHLVKTEDLLKAIAKKKAGKMLVGFSLEDKDGLSRAREKMKAKKLDLIVVNTSDAVGRDRIKAGILRGEDKRMVLEEKTKWQLANLILDECSAQLKVTGKK